MCDLTDSNQLSVRRGFSMLCAALVFASGCFGGYHDGLEKHPVRGTVTIDGEPAEGVIVRFFCKDESKAGANAQFPVGITNDDGEFKVSTNGDGDGAVEGDYEVTIVWPENDQPPLRDRLGGEYATVEKSKLKVTIERGENVLPPFALKRGNGPSVKSPASRLDDD